MKKLILLTLLVCSCAPRQAGDYVRMEEGFALGTTWNATVNMPDTTGFRASVDSLLRGVEASMSVYDPTSLLSRLNRNETDSVDANIAHCLAVAARVSRLSGGEYDVTLGPVIEAWGFNDAPPADGRPNLDSLMQFVGWDRIRVDNGHLLKDDPRVQIDLNSVAKGYAVDLLAGLAANRGATDFMLNVGGEIVCRGVREDGGQWRIGIDEPVDGNHIAGARRQAILRISDAAIATSGNYRRFYTDADGNKVVHTISGATGESRPTDMLSATVVAPTCAEADALATMLMAVGSRRALPILAARPDIRAYLIYRRPDGRQETFVSEGLIVE